MQDFHKLSISIENLRFPLVFFIIMLHCYTTTNMMVRGHADYFRMVYPFALWLGETGVPAYFFISGILLFYSRKKYGQRLQSRMKTLLVPYLIFNGFILIGYIFMMIFGVTVIIQGKNLADYNIFDYVRALWDRGTWLNGNGTPLLCPFWYIRNLMVLVILSPILYFIIKYTKLLFPIIMGFFWINSFDSAYTFQSLTMFSLGAYFPINGYNPMTIFVKYKYIFIVFFVFLGITDLSHPFIHVPYAPQIHRMSLITNVFFLIWIGQYLSKYHFLYSPSLSKSAFFVFCIHYPLVQCTKVLFSRLGNSPDTMIFVAYLFCVTCVTVITVSVYYLMRRLMPGFLNFITGSRA